MAERRAVPAVYVIDAGGNVLFSRTDPNERRRELQSRGNRLPSLVEETVHRLCAERLRISPRPGMLVSAPNASLLVRVLWPDGPGETIAVLAERFRIRDYLASARNHYSLTGREAEVLSLLVGGLRNAEIASRLQISPSTAIFHVKRLLVKMDARNRTELVSKFLE
ncbi:MAG TPA: LuxR C-terminal-related transcriptional regulator [Candidatus Baltobacteraceae bacterium]|nr:LuxR C-terminal-related transcriptional regulator [Candidatus Baltobacteraceae bacterium]